MKEKATTILVKMTIRRLNKKILRQVKEIIIYLTVKIQRFSIRTKNNIVRKTYYSMKKIM